LDIDLPKVKPAARKFNASLSFSHRPPFDPLFAERVPVLQAFHLALANYRLERAQSYNSWWERAKQLLKPAPLFNAVECGVYTGSSLIACASMAHEAKIPFQMYGLDTFAGLPPVSEKDREFAPAGARYLGSRLFTDTSLASVQEKVVAAQLEQAVELRQGLFSDTLPLLPERRYHFVNIDCDLYEPHIECLEYFYPRMVSGGILFFDDYHSVEYPMAGKAIDDFMSDKPEQLLHLRFGKEGTNHTKCFFIKYP
jgi:O-methyltransferase